MICCRSDLRNIIAKTMNFTFKIRLFCLLLSLSGISISADAQFFQWTKKGVSQGFEYGNGICTDDSGYVYVTGQIEYTTDFGTLQLYAIGSHDIFVGKYSPSGDIKWIKKAGSVGGDVGRSVGVDANYNVYATGEFEKSTYFTSNDSVISAGSNDIFLAKYDINGNLVWVKRYGGSSDDKGRALAVDSAGNSYIGAYFSSSVSFGSTNLSSSGSNDIAIFKVNSSGDVQWAKKAGGTREDRPRGVALDRSGNILVTGTFTNSCTFSGTTLTGTGPFSSFTAKYTNSGNLEWVRAGVNTTDTTRSNAIATDPAGNSYIAGYYKQTAVFGSNSVTSAGANDIFVAKYDPNGNVLWLKSAGGPYDDMANGISYDPTNNLVYVTGQIDDHGYFDNIYVGAAGNRDVFVAAYDPNGNIVWVRAAGSKMRDAGLAVTQDTLGNIYNTGFFTDTATFGATTLQGYPLADFYLTRISPQPASAPTMAASSLIASGSGCNNIQLNWTNGNGTRRLVIARANAPVNAFPSNGTEYTGNPSFGNGPHLGSGNYVMYNGNGNNLVISNLNPGVVYHFTVIEYNGYGPSSNYLGSGNPVTNRTNNALLMNINASAQSFCVGGSATLIASNANSFTWSPADGLSSTTDQTVVASPASTTTYTVNGENAYGCQASASVTISVYTEPPVLFTATSGICINTPSFQLTGATPTGGTYSGPGVNNGSFNPSVAGIGSHILTYSYTDSQGCSGSDTALFTVNSLPSVSFGSFSPLCANAAPVQLNSGSPSGGVYSGSGVSGQQFNPSIAGPGNHTLTYTYTNSNGCSASANTSVTVNAFPSVSLASFSSVCLNTASFTLSGGSPSGGTYSGNGVSAGMFNPGSAGQGTHAITYTYTNSSGCSNTASRNIVVNNTPSVSLSSFSDICSNAQPVTLSGGNPAGGVYSGNGVSGGSFNPNTAGAGTHTITYTYTDIQGCSGSAQSSIVVKPASNVTLSAFNPVCSNVAAFTLSGGAPSGGTYTGTGVTGNMFNPSIGPGTYTIWYSYTDPNGCFANVSRPLTVNPVPSVSASPIPNACTNQGSFTLTAGSPSGGVYTGTGVSGGMFNPGIAGVGNHSISYTYTNPQGCSASASTNVTVNPSPSVDLGPDSVVCASAAVVLNAGSGFSAVLWSTGATSNSISVDSSGVGFGIKTVHVRVENSFGCSARDTIQIRFDACAGIAGPSTEFIGVYLYPNPFSDFMKVLTEKVIDLRIYDVSGRMLEKKEGVQGLITAGKELAAGTYFLEVSAGELRRVYHIVKTSR
ncbi:MAG: T9SS C-terminal target domain-containing protein [Bacteroidetes bacterium]|nr:MAG: T9SS C-terminal target domain-containing protein [Bacteroidota bacterium]REK03363.1 MAG: T9SS C-terminal target domain-containing protein [Bacteroidota bacterium]REK34526.1 MAG: T9SS C-terminal target domain-containing protein [Bacteroidota bacterium]